LRCCFEAGRCARPRGGTCRAGAGAGEALAVEWDAQKDRVDPAVSRSRGSPIRSSNGLRPRPSGRGRDRKILGTDLLFLPRRNAAGLVAASSGIGTRLSTGRENLGARLVLPEGIVHVPQPERRSLAAVRCDSDGVDVKEHGGSGALNVVTP